LHRERKKEILFIDARKLGTMVSRKLRAFSENDIEKVASVYHQWRNVKGKYKNEEGFCYSASIDEVKAQNGILSPGRYVGTEEEQSDDIPFEEKIDLLYGKLIEQFALADELKTLIVNNLNSIKS
jgi:type I restriction enzyme M protein